VNAVGGERKRRLHVVVDDEEQTRLAAERVHRTAALDQLCRRGALAP
jgi:hypothetical protein